MFLIYDPIYWEIVNIKSSIRRFFSFPINLNLKDANSFCYDKYLFGETEPLIKEA